MSLSTRILLGLVLGLAAGILYSFGDGQAFAALPAIVEPLGTMWVNAIRMTVAPLIVALLITSIAGEHKGGLVAKLGGKTIGLFVVMIAAVSVYTMLLAPPLLSLLQIDPAIAASLLESTDAAAATAAELPPFRDWLIGLIPTNPFAAAVGNDMLPLLVFVVLFAVALMRIEAENCNTILRFFTAIKDAMLVLIHWIMLIAPFGVFALVFPLAARMGFTAVTALGSFVVIACGLITLMMVLLYPLAIVVGRLPAATFIRAMAPVQVIGFSTRSSLAALPATVAATEALGISASVSGLVLPIAVSLFKFASPIARTAGTYFIANLYGIELGPTEIVVTALAIGLFSFYSPGIPSGGLLIMAPVYLSLGLPVAGIGILIAVDLIVDMFITATNVTANVTVAALLTRADRAPATT
jgi:Na+/H+-dicarboxylate symporter